MTDKETQPNQAADLRRDAEEIIRGNADQSPENLLAMSCEETRHVIHELRVHQIELEMQNSVLCQRQEELDASRARYFDLYELAPVGYVTLNENGLVTEANLTAATMLGVARGVLGLAQPIFSQFIHIEDQDIYYLFRKQLFKTTGKPQATDLRMVKKDGPVFWAHLEATVTQDPSAGSPRPGSGQAGESMIRVVISDISADQNLKEAQNLLEQMVEERSKQLRQQTGEPPAEGADTILLVDDEPHILSALTRTLKNTGYEVLTAGSGSQALAIMETTKIKVIVSDEQMEEMRGSELLAEVQKRFPHALRILMSGHTTQEMAMRAVNEGGIYRFIAKPWDDTLLRLALSAATEKYNADADKRRLQDALLQSEERYRTVVEQSPQSVVVHRNGTIIYVNPAAIQLFGAASLQDLAGKPIIDRIHPNEHQAFLTRLQVTSRWGVRSPMVERRYLKLDGTGFTGEIMGTPIIYDGLPAIHLAIHDITDRKRAEEALRVSDERFELVSKAANDAIYDFDLISGTAWLSAAHHALLGVADDHADFTWWSSHIHPEDRERVISSMNTAMEQGGPVWWDEYRFQCADGRYVDILDRGHISRDEKGIPVRLVGSMMDITERKRIQEALRESENRYRILADNATDIIWTIDMNMRLTYASPSVTRHLGFTVKEAMARTMHEVYTPASFEKAMTIFAAEMEIEKSGDADPFRSLTVELELFGKDGTIVPVEGNYSFLRDPAGRPKGILGIMRNIKKRKLVEEALKKSEEKYRELSVIDGLTQLHNSRHFYQQLQMEIDRTNRYEEPLTLILLDIDNFKGFNDAYGHVEGDQVLSRLGQVVKRCMRKTDSAYRYGGEEFTILLPMTTSTDGAFTAERIRMEFKGELFKTASNHDVNMTVSIGIGQYKPQDDMKVFVHKVDQLMYQAKKTGKDRVCSESSF